VEAAWGKSGGPVLIGPTSLLRPNRTNDRANKRRSRGFGIPAQIDFWARLNDPDPPMAIRTRRQVHDAKFWNKKSAICGFRARNLHDSSALAPSEPVRWLAVVVQAPPSVRIT